MGENIRNHFFFGPDVSHPTCYTPVTPIFIAFAMLVDTEHYEWIFRIVVQAVSFIGVLWLVRELSLLTGKKWLGGALLLIVAICRPSIFWSLKPATEPVYEALLYLTAAMALATLRTQTMSLALLSGSTALLLGLNRPNLIPGAAFIPVAFLVNGFVASRSASKRIAPTDERQWQLGGLLLRHHSTILLVVFFFGFFGTWSVWIGRNLINYGVFIPTSSSGLLSLNWEYAGRPVRVGRYNQLKLFDGSTISKFDLKEIRVAPTAVESDKKLAMIARAWFAANWRDFPKVFVWRLNHLIAARGANGLTTLPREDLFPPSLSPKYLYPSPQTSWINMLLIDKTPSICFVALIGLSLFLYKFRAAGTIFLGLALVPWLTAALVLGWERIVEAQIALTIWFALFAIVSILSWLDKSEDVPPDACAD